MAALFQELDSGSRGVLGPEQGAALLRRLCPVRLARGQLEYLLAVLDNEQVGAITLESINACLE